MVPAASAPLLVAEDVHVSFGDRPVLRGVDLEVHPGEVVALVGAKGAGRSTLCRTLNRTEPVDAGRITLAGAELAESGAALATLRADVPLILPRYNLAAGRTLLSNCAATAVKVRGRSPEAAATEARAALRRVGLEGRSDAPAGELSALEAQQAALARALAGEPKVLLLDEVTAALTEPEATALHQIVRPLVRADGVTAIVVDRDADRVRELADRVVVLERGRVVEDSPTARFFTGPHSAAGRSLLRRSELDEA